MTQHDPSLAIAELRANVSVPFERAHAMPKSVYTSEAFAKAEEEHIFAREWLCAGRADALPNPGDYLTMTITKQPGAAYEVQSAGSLNAVDFSASTTTILLNDATTLKVRDNTPASSPVARFMRVKVTGAP